MRCDNIFLDSIGTYLPQSRPLDDVRAAGLVDEREAAEWPWTGVAEAGAISPPDMAVQAGREAMLVSSVPTHCFRMLIHAGSVYQGSVMWPLHHYIQRHTIGDTGTALEIRQACSGGIAALQLAASALTAQRGAGAVLVTGADNHYWFDRFDWLRHHLAHNRSVALLGDAGHGIVVTNTGGFASLDSIATGSVPEFEEAFRLPGQQFPVSTSPPTPDEVRAVTAAAGRHPQWLRVLSFTAARTALATAQQALDDAGVTASDVTYYLPGFMAGAGIADLITRRLGVAVPDGLQDFGRTVGHLSVSDHAIGIAHLSELGLLRPGARLLIGATGFAASMAYAVITIHDQPRARLARPVRVPCE
ncbi:3-oxoacyl-[acyl-carrier-protein] synthase III C-terminal domain-containing protein [Gordonia sp. ABSL1-1]|uniref:3-oxoacyl-[acyl-carrier-protein] synthase III C-terminal domain-containing protein n=1 Tax=Gordonia sp. ABSL1-1 TaxID=3053923 RepID=UPI0025725518|nr:3-oxoacyl-[acyl-carrier-protein] synthase III C-terminal domain-containing protein [Gordonia sp. ABSL1-1]MDL9936530.1 3-oxoacyl-[acyl-carrier-protein] synthase III C-terminal domain-containing protein [Gordonia sp. ABSL1-1]